jgi:cytochrome b561
MARRAAWNERAARARDRTTMRNAVSRYVAVLWLMAALSLIGWLLVNLDTAGWILVILTVGLMTWELTARSTRNPGRGGEGRPFGHPDEPSR